MTMRNKLNTSELPQGADKQPYVITSAYRTLEVLKAFAQPPHKFALSDLSKRLGLEKNQLYRSLKTLEQADFLIMQEDGRFALTAIVHDLSAASAQPPEKSIVEVAQPFLDELAQKTNESVNLFVRSGDLAVCVDRRDSSQPVKLTSVLGMSVALHAGAVPKAMLAYLEKTEQSRILKSLDNLPKYTDKTVLDLKKLERELVLVQERGYSVSDEDFDASARGVGAVILDASGQVTAGMSVGGPSFRVDDAKLEVFGQLIVEVTQKISKQLGYSGKSYKEVAA